ncbi:MAG: hypothetical protein ACTHJ4_00155, partial [Candidatus Nucleicultricaceae bacterium]
SIRSFDGAAATFKTTSALGLLVCTSKDDGANEGFNGSTFAGKAKEKLGFKNNQRLTDEDLANIREQFVASLKSAKGKVLALGCSAASGGALATGAAAPLAGVIGGACAKAGH